MSVVRCHGPSLFPQLLVQGAVYSFARPPPLSGTVHTLSTCLSLATPFAMAFRKQHSADLETWMTRYIHSLTH